MQNLHADLFLQKMSENPEGSLNLRLYHCIRMAILENNFLPNSQLPASRCLGKEMKISRNTVIAVYEQLMIEGYIYMKKGSGTFVAQTLPDPYFNPELLSNPKEPNLENKTHVQSYLSERAEDLLKHAFSAKTQWGAFMPGVPDVMAFPQRRFSQIQTQIGKRPSPDLLTYCNHQGGVPSLKCALVDHLKLSRMITCTEKQILVTEGTHQAIDIITKMLCDVGDTVWIEDPGYWGIRNVLRINGVRIIPIEVDDEGMIIPKLKDGETPPKLIVVTPSHQYPLGAVMSLARRRQLLAFAAYYQAWIIEDDYDSEFRFSGNPIPALQSLEADAPVIYVGTFSKTIYPALRISYLVLPQKLTKVFKTAHAELYRGGRLLIQATLAQFIEKGYYAAHVRAMRLRYDKRRLLLKRLISEQLGEDFINAYTNNAGLHLIINLPDHIDDVTLAENIGKDGVLVRPLSRYYMKLPTKQGLLLGYASVSEEKIIEAFEVVAEHIRLLFK